MKQKYFFLLFSITSFFITSGQNNALNLSGAGWLRISSIPAGSTFSLNSEAFTIEYDFYMNALTNYNAGFSSLQTTNLAKPIKFYVNSSGQSILSLGNGSNEETISGMPVFNIEQWYHVAMVVVNTITTKNIKFYVNGTEIVNANFTQTLLNIDYTGGDITLGSTEYNNTTNAKFDNLRVWSVARTASEIAATYNTCLTNNETGLQANYMFDGFNSYRIRNLVASAYISHASIVNTYSFSTGSGCSITPLYNPITVTGNYAGIYYYNGIVNGKPSYKTDDIQCNLSSTEADCDYYPIRYIIIWENNEWVLRNEVCVWLFTSCATGNLNANTNTNDTTLPPCSGWSNANSTFSSQECIALNTSEVSLKENMAIFPNPNNGNFTINSKEVLNIEVYNLIGKSILQQKIETGINSIDISNYSSGLYILKATNTLGNTANFKIIKE